MSRKRIRLPRDHDLVQVSEASLMSCIVADFACSQVVSGGVFHRQNQDYRLSLTDCSHLADGSISLPFTGARIGQPRTSGPKYMGAL